MTTRSVPTNSPELRHPRVADGSSLWRIARDSNVLDVNSPYAYLLWCRDFAATSVVAGHDEVVGFVTGYVRPDDPATYFLWQVAVDSEARGRGVAAAMVDWVFAHAQRSHPEVSNLETTITDDNVASRGLFAAFADRHDASLQRTPLFNGDLFPPDSGSDHATEYLHRIGPIAAPQDVRTDR